MKSVRLKKINKKQEDKKQVNEGNIAKSLKENMIQLKQIFQRDETVIFRSFQNQKAQNVKCCIIFSEMIVDKEKINQNIIYSIMYHPIEEEVNFSTLIETMQKNVIAAYSVKKSSQLDEIIEGILCGDTIVLFDEVEEALIVETKKLETRGIEEPPSEGVVRGPREGFTEGMYTNLSLIRRRIKSPDLKFKFKKIGKLTKTQICICYIEGIVSEKILTEAEKRLDAIDMDGILESSYIEEIIKDAPYSPFKTIGSTERPDVVAGKLLEGRIAIVCDGTPYALTLPFIFIEYFQSNEDYYTDFFFGSFNRLLRLGTFFLSSSTPSIYLALVTFHQELIPTPMLLSISAARQGVPLPTILEALGMLLVFDILREAGVRLPKPIGQAVSIVGALVLGEAAVTARIISAPMIIVVGLTGISGFLINPMLGALIIVRYLLLFAASFLGLYGYLFTFIGVFIHLASLRSFGVPYMLQTSIMNLQDLKDTAVRAPWWALQRRPKFAAQNKTRYREKR